jgi:hypothetical protein
VSSGRLRQNRWRQALGQLHRAGGAQHDRDQPVVLQVAADPTEPGGDLDAQATQQIRVADAGALQDHRRSDGAGRQHHVVGLGPLDPAGTVPFHAGTTVSSQQQPVHPGVADDPQPRLVPHRLQVGAGRGEPACTSDRELGEGNPVRPRPVVVGVERNPVLHGRLDDGLVDRMRLELRHHILQPGPAVGRAGVDAFDPPEHRPHVGPGPPRVSQVGPHVVVERVPAHPDHSVERMGSADQAAPRQVQHPIVRVLLWDGAKAPVDLAVPELVHPQRVLDRRDLSIGTGLQQQNREPRVQQPPRHHATGRAGPDHDDVGGGGPTPLPPAGGWGWGQLGGHQTGCSSGYRTLPSSEMNAPPGATRTASSAPRPKNVPVVRKASRS